MDLVVILGKRDFRMSLHILDRDKPLKSDWWLKVGRSSYFISRIVCRVPIVTKLNKRQPIGSMIGTSALHIMIDYREKTAYIS
jgi:hypothetical protein